MARLVFARGFLEELARLDPRVETAVWRKLELVQGFPGVSSSLVEPLLRHAYGPNCLKVAAAGYDVLYERHPDSVDPSDEEVDVLGIVAQRAVR